MIGKRKLLAEALFRARALDAWPADPGRLVVFNYHRLHGAFARPTPFDSGVFGPTARAFGAQLTWLAHHCNVLGEDELLHATRTGRWPRGRNVVITFDDAYAEQYRIAWPLLRHHGLPAIFFVPTQAIAERRLGFWDLIAYVVKKAERPRVALDGVEYELGGDAAAGTFRRIADRMKLEPAARTADLVDRLASACGVALPSAEVQDAELMTFAQLREIAQSPLGAIGSHTHSHRVLATLDEVEQAKELTSSRAILEHEIGRPVRTIAYPVGNYAHFTRSTKGIARRVGYDLAFSFCTGANPRGEVDPYDVRRSATGVDDGALGMFAAAATLPAVFP